MCTTEEQNKVSAEDFANNQPVANQSQPEQIPEPTYRLALGEEEIYGMTRWQMEDLYRRMQRFIEREKSPFTYPARHCDEDFIGIAKAIDLYDDGNGDRFAVHYALTTCGQSLFHLSAAQMKRLAETMLEFLRVFGENGERKVCWQAEDYPVENLPFTVVRISPDRRQEVPLAAAKVHKFIYREEGMETAMSYTLEVNRQTLSDLSFGEFLTVYRELGTFLATPPENSGSSLS